jgi:hypothetical protein
MFFRESALGIKSDKRSNLLSTDIRFKQRAFGPSSRQFNEQSYMTL